MSSPSEWPHLDAQTRPTRIDHELGSGVTVSCVHWNPAPVDDPPSTPWLLVHGLASNARLWDGVARRLAARGHPVVAVDQRGHGRSEKPDDGYSMEIVADDLRFLLDDLGWARAAVAGQSWGASVVVELGARHPHVVGILACVDGVLGGLKKRFPDWIDAQTALAPPKLLGQPRSVIEGWIAQNAADWPEEGRLGTMANFEVREDNTIAPWLTFERHLEVLRGMWEYEPGVRYAEVAAPVLIIQADSGEGTDLKELAVQAAASKLATSRIEWFRPAHHDVHAQHPDRVADLLQRAVSEPDFFSTGGVPT